MPPSSSQTLACSGCSSGPEKWLPQTHQCARILLRYHHRAWPVCRPGHTADLPRRMARALSRRWHPAAPHALHLHLRSPGSNGRPVGGEGFWSFSGIPGEFAFKDPRTLVAGLSPGQGGRSLRVCSPNLTQAQLRISHAAKKRLFCGVEFNLQRPSPWRTVRPALQGGVKTRQFSAGVSAHSATVM